MPLFLPVFDLYDLCISIQIAWYTTIFVQLDMLDPLCLPVFGPDSKEEQHHIKLLCCHTERKLISGVWGV